jgi:hypothetical protein
MAGASEGLKQHWGQRNGGAEAQKWLEERYTVTDLEDVAGHLQRRAVRGDVRLSSYELFR